MGFLKKDIGFFFNDFLIYICFNKERIKMSTRPKRIRTKDGSFKLPEPSFLPQTDKKYKKDFARQGFYLTLMGATDVQMGQAFGVSASTINAWKRNYPDFLQAIQEGKIMADANVSYSLYLAAIGYSHPEQVVIPNKIKEFDDRGKLTKEYTEALIVNTTKHHPPNVTAGLKWLQARQPQVWGNKLHVSGEVQHKHSMDLTNFSTEELEVLKKVGLNLNGENVEDVEFNEIKE